MNFALPTSQLPPDDGVWTLPQSTGVPLPAPAAEPTPAADDTGAPAELSPGVLEERALLGAPFVPEPEAPLATQEAEADLPPVGPTLQVDPRDPRRLRPPDVDPFQAEQAEAEGYAWKRSGILQAPPGGDSMRLVDG